MSALGAEGGNTMRELARRGLAVAVCLLLLLSSTAMGSEGDTYQSTNRSARQRSTLAQPINDSWWPFGRAEREAARQRNMPRIATEPNESEASLAANGMRKMNPKEVAIQVERTMQTYFRRLAVCDRIKELAEETGDPALEAQAELLQQRAWMICQQRINQLRMPGLLPDRETEATDVLTAEKAAAATGHRAATKAPVRAVRGDSAVYGEKE